MTPAIRAAEAAQVPFTVHRYDHDPRVDSFGLEAAEKLGFAPERVYKTLIAQVDGAQLVLVMIPVAARLDLKKLAAVAGGKKAEMADPAAAQRATGYVIGGISPVGGRKKLPAFIESNALSQATVCVSAGQRGLQIELAPQDLMRLTNATAAALTTAAPG